VMFGPRRNEVKAVDLDLGIYDVYVLVGSRESALDIGRVLIENQIGVR